MGTWIIWLVVAAVLGVAEVLIARLAFGLVAAGALVGAVVGAAGGNPALQFGAFALTSAAGLGLVRPFALRHIRQPPLLRTGTAALVGRSAYVLDEGTAQSGRGPQVAGPRHDPDRAVHRPGQAPDRPARAGGLVSRPAGDHRGQPGREDRYGAVLPGHGPARGRLRDRQLHPGDRAAHRDHAAQRDRVHGPGG